MHADVGREFARGDVIAWRRGQLLRSGFAYSIAAQLAVDRRYDLHQLIELVERGCPVDLAVRILAPLEPEQRA